LQQCQTTDDNEDGKVENYLRCKQSSIIIIIIIKANERPSHIDGSSNLSTRQSVSICL